MTDQDAGLKQAGADLMSISRDARSLEDYRVGEFGEATISEKEMLEFARRYDPQHMHIDPLTASESPFGRIIASGWHTAAVMSRLYVEHYLPTHASLPSPAMDELRWRIPVYPDDCLSLRVTVLHSRRSESKPDRGILVSEIEVLNQNREVTMTLKATNMMLTRDDPASRD